MKNEKNLEFLKTQLEEKDKIINLLQNKFKEKTGTDIELPQNLNKFLNIEEKNVPIKDITNIKTNKKSDNFIDKINSLCLPNKLNIEKLKKDKNKKNQKSTDFDPTNINHMVQYINLSNYKNKNFNKLIFKDFLDRIVDMKCINAINLSGNGLNDDYLEEIKVLFSYKNIKKIDLSENNFAKLTGNFIANYIKENNHLTWIDLSRNNFTYEFNIVNNIITGLKKHDNLFHFGINYSNKADNLVENMVKLSSLKSIKSFKIIDTKFTNNSFNNLCKIINKKSNLKAVCLKFSFLNQINIETLESTLNKNKGLIKLDLSNNYIGSFLGIKLIKFLKNNIFLTYLNLSKNNLNDYFCNYFCKVMKSNDTLAICDLSYNQITENSSEKFINLLMNSNYSLNSIGDLSTTTSIGVMNFIKIKNLLDNNKKNIGERVDKSSNYTICKPFSDNIVLNNNEFGELKLWNI